MAENLTHKDNIHIQIKQVARASPSEIMEREGFDSGLLCPFAQHLAY
jgi:hypothetical protein